MFQVQIKTNGVISVVSVEASSKKEAVKIARTKNPKSIYLMAWEGNPPVTKSPKGKSPQEIIDKLKSEKKVKNGTNN